MSDAAAIFLLVGALLTVLAFAMLFAKRYPKRGGWLAVGIAIGVAAMFLWPITIWVACALWLTGFARPGLARAQSNPDTPGDPDPSERSGAGRPFPKKIVVPLCVVAALITAGVLGELTEPVAEPSQPAAGPTPTSAPSSTPLPPPRTTVVDVIDGETLTLNDGRTVRVSGIDVPATAALGKPVECWGPEAAAFARLNLLNRPVTLAPDPAQTPPDDLGATVAAVLLPDGQDFSVLATQGGYARADRRSALPQHFEAIMAAESEARAARLGLWGPACAPPVPVPRPQPEPAPVVPPQPARTAQPTRAPADEPDGGGSVYYENCSAARAAGAAPLYAGEPGYRSGLDRDNDGVACDR